MILASMPGCNVPGYQEECWHCLFLAVPDPGGAVQRMLCRKRAQSWQGRKALNKTEGRRDLNVPHAC